MEYNVEKREISLKDKVLNDLDKFVLNFVKILTKYTDYVVVSGYVSILLGRSRATEDIDLLVPKIEKANFEKLWAEIIKQGFECINTYESNKAFDMLNEHAIRFFKEIPVPNIEFKQIKNDIDKYSFQNRLKVVLSGGIVYISPIEEQIAYKLFLGSEKDLEDAKHLYSLFKEKLNKEELSYFVNKLNVEEEFKIIENGEI